MAEPQLEAATLVASATTKAVASIVYACAGGNRCRREFGDWSD